MKVPVIGESIAEVTLSQWLKEDGDYVALDESICEFESDKATLEFPAEAAGKLIYVAQEGDDLEIGALVAKIDTSVQAGKEEKSTAPAPEVAAPKAEAEAASPAPTKSDSYAAGTPSPAAAKILKENGIAATAVTAAAPVAKTTSAFSRDENRKKMSRMRRTIAKRLVQAKNETAMLTTFNEVDLKGVMDLRKKYQEQFVEKYGIKLGFMSLFAKACAKVLLEMPDVNAFIDGNELIYHDYADISIAISTPTGLVVPPVHNVESLGFAEIEHKIKELAGKARNGTLTLDEMQGGTFTITNGGIFGSLISTPIINLPQSAILGMHGIKNRPV
ncbi:UNVERIFIED_CONTAM: hypothetical protein GTU68_067110, partial [Idotea baltica]|nr:hypothetical protein [Idotea baltica]